MIIFWLCRNLSAFSASVVSAKCASMKFVCDGVVLIPSWCIAFCSLSLFLLFVCLDLSMCFWSLMAAIAAICAAVEVLKGLRILFMLLVMLLFANIQPIRKAASPYILEKVFITTRFGYLSTNLSPES